MILYNVIVGVSNYGSKEFKHQITLLEIEAKETKSSYVWEGRRLAKEDVGVLKLIHNSDRDVSYRIFAMPDDLEDAKKRALEALKEKISEKVALYQTYQKMVLEEKPSVVEFKDELAELRKRQKGGRLN